PSLRQWQRDPELGAPARLARDLDRSLVGLDDLLRDRHAESGSLLLGGEERVEDAFDLVGRDAASVVAYPDDGPTVAVLEEQVDPPSLRDAGQSVDRVVEQVGEDRAELLRVGLDGRTGDVVARDGDLARVELGTE